MKYRQLILTLLLIWINLGVFASRRDILINNNWSFRFSYQVKKEPGQRVDLPHTWNAQDALAGDIFYKRGIGIYEKQLFIRPEWKGKRLFIKFDGANTVSDVFINMEHIGEHRGGYSAFLFEITGRVEYGRENMVTVKVNNSPQLDVMPLVGDFNFYGGIYRDVHLIITDEVCISPLDYASPGVYLIQQQVSSSTAQVKARILLSSSSDRTRKVELKMQVFYSDKLMTEQSAMVNIEAGQQKVEEMNFSIKNPRLWNGKEDPFMYYAEVTLLRDGIVTDHVKQPLGLRFYHIDPDKGFFLNGKHLSLHGVNRHQDRSEIGNALSNSHHDEDVALMTEMGVNAVRLSHYPQASYLYDLMDRSGIIVWTEIPFVGPGGYADKGYMNLTSFKENGKDQLRELIRQNYNHPSICFWGLFNELKEPGDSPVEYVKELNFLAHQEDPSRLTTAASNSDGDINFITDIIAWNRYDGWYGGMPDQLGTWIDKTHNQHPSLNIGISEYGAGASIYHHQDSLVKTVPVSWWHPENWQTYYHIENWKVISDRPYLWGSFIWNMFDFGAAHRTEGDKPGRNDKGLVTFDRKTRKDAFYFYKANWNKAEKTLYIAERRNTIRSRDEISVMVFSNCGAVKLMVNDEEAGIKSPDSRCVVRFDKIKLQDGENRIEAISVDNKAQDSCIWFYR